MSVPIAILDRIHPEVAPFQGFMKEKRVAETLECILHAYVNIVGTETSIFSDCHKQTVTELVVAIHTSFRLTSRLYRIFPDIAVPHSGEETAAEDGLSAYRDHAEKYFARLEALWSDLERMLSRSRKRRMGWARDASKDEEKKYSGRRWEEVATYLVAIDYDEVEYNLSELKVWNGEIKAWIRKPLLTWAQRYAFVRLVSHR